MALNILDHNYTEIEIENVFDITSFNDKVVKSEKILNFYQKDVVKNLIKLIEEVNMNS